MNWRFEYKKFLTAQDRKKIATKAGITVDTLNQFFSKRGEAAVGEEKSNRIKEEALNLILERWRQTGDFLKRESTPGLLKEAA